MTKPQLREMIELADMDGDGGIDYNEFCRLLGVRRLSAMLERQGGSPSVPVQKIKRTSPRSARTRRRRRDPRHDRLKESRQEEKNSTFSPAAVELPSPTISSQMSPPPLPSSPAMLSVPSSNKYMETRLVNLLIRQHFENTMLLRTLRNVVAEDLESDQYEILDKVLETADKDCLEMQSGTFGSNAEEFATRLASRQKQQLSKHLKSIELHVSKARAERHWRLKGILAKEVERASRAREDMNRYRLELNRVTGLTPKREEKNVPREKSIVPSTFDEDKKKHLAIVPESPTESSQPRTLPPTQINVHLPPDWDGRSIEIFMSEDEYEDGEYEEDGEYGDEFPPVPVDTMTDDASEF